MLFRSVRSVQLYEAALLESGVPVIVNGDANIFEDRRVLDALALLWNVYDPFRHDWLLRTLGNPAVGLSDASLAILCGEPADPQRQLFAFEDEPAPTLRPGRWDAKRDLRLGWNVIRGERDDALSDDAISACNAFGGCARAGCDAATPKRSRRSRAACGARDSRGRERPAPRALSRNKRFCAVCSRG